MNKFKNAFEKAVITFKKEMKGPDQERIEENREKLMETWKTINYVENMDRGGKFTY